MCWPILVAEVIIKARSLSDALPMTCRNFRDLNCRLSAPSVLWQRALPIMWFLAVQDSRETCTMVSARNARSFATLSQGYCPSISLFRSGGDLYLGLCIPA